MGNYKEILDEFDKSIAKTISKLTDELDKVCDENKGLLASGNEEKLDKVLKIIMGAEKIKAGLINRPISKDTTAPLKGKEKELAGKIVRPSGNN